ncbi:hypothetical protein ASC92_27740 [Variovorax sp. Root411]|nr:hypothetical protein ASC92_27740 [Variovorax sp. Root411]
MAAQREAIDLRHALHPASALRTHLLGERAQLFTASTCSSTGSPRYAPSSFPSSAKKSRRTAPPRAS